MGAKMKQLFAELFGFACFQGFLFALFVMGPNVPLSIGSLEFHRGSLFVVLISAAIMLALLRCLPSAALRDRMKPALTYLYALLLIAASFLLLFLGETYQILGLVAASVQGLALAPLLCCWGRLLGSLNLDDASFIVILGSVVGAVVAALCCLAPEYLGHVLIDLLPLGAASTLQIRLKEPLEYAEAQAPSAKAIDLSGRIMAGALVFGVGCGFAHSYVGVFAGAEVSFMASLLIFIMLGVAALQIFFRPVAIASALKENQPQFAARQGSLTYVYRLAVLMMVAGFLFAPALQHFTFNGQSIVFAGFLGLLMVLLVVFLINALTTSRDPVLTFSAGFALLLTGQALGLALGGLCNGLMAPGSFETWAFAIAGLFVLIAYLFLFTENDLGELGTVVDAIDSFDEACERLVKECGLSKREAEILPLALKGRTGERIAEQFVISKSTVDTHLRRIYGKCGVHSRQELIDLGERTAEEVARQQRNSQ